MLKKAQMYFAPKVHLGDFHSMLTHDGWKVPKPVLKSYNLFESRLKSWFLNRMHFQDATMKYI